MTRNSTTGAFVGAGAGVAVGYAVVWYFDGWSEASDTEKVMAVIAGLAAFNVAARGTSP